MVERSRAALAGAVGTCAVAASVVARYDGALYKNLCNQFSWAAATYPKPEVTLNVCGGIKLMSVEEPAPGLVGFLSVVSMRVQPSPFSPQLPDCGEASVWYYTPMAVSTNPSAGNWDDMSKW